MTGNENSLLRHFTDSARIKALKQKDNVIYAGSYDKTLRLYDTRTRASSWTHILSGHTSTVRFTIYRRGPRYLIHKVSALDFSEAGDSVFAGDFAGRVLRWDMR